MDKSADTDDAVNSGADLRTPEPKGPPRRLVQSTLFPCKLHEIEPNCNGKSEKDYAAAEGGEEDDCCGSQKRNRNHKGKTTPQSGTSKKRAREQNTPKKSAVNNGHIRACSEDENGKEGECCGSQKKSRKPKGKTTPQSRSSKKVRERGTPNNNALNNGHMRACSLQIEFEDTSPPVIPNLRLEAQMMATENSRIFAGKQIHPFFTSWKAGKKSQETSDMEIRVEQKDKSTVTVGPIHVYEGLEEDNATLNWTDWTFCEKSHVDTSYGGEGSFASIFEGSVHIFRFDSFSKKLCTSSVSCSHNQVSLNHCFTQGQCHKISTAISAAADEQVSCYPILHDIEVVSRADQIHNTNNAGKSDTEWQTRIIQERMMADYYSRDNQPEDSLWIDKYRPRRATEVCGNTESVKFLNEWLRNWHQNELQNNIGNNKINMEEMDCCYYPSDCDSEDVNGGGGFRNVLLVKGPAGSGKTAAIYACAKEQGFRVLEVNASECRTGAVVKHKFGEALQSFWRSRSVKNHVASKSKWNNKNSLAPNNRKGMLEPANEVIEVIPVSDEEDSHNTTGTSGKLVYESKDGCDQDELKPLILFEDVDIIFSEDRGFIAAVQEIAETAKGPMILTSSVENPALPENMDRLEVCFIAPPPEELLLHAHKVCQMEKVSIHPYCIQQLIAHCQGDIRRTLMSLQFLCCNGKYEKDVKLQRPFDPLIFDPEPGHQILPAVLPWDIPSQLSELVEQKIANSLSMVEKHASLSVVFEEELEDKEMMTRSTQIRDTQTAGIEAKKEAMLRRNSSAYDCNALATVFDTGDELSNSSGTPVAFSWRNAKRKFDTIVSSDSEDGHLKERQPRASNTDIDDELSLKVESKMPPPCQVTQNFSTWLTDGHIPVASIRDINDEVSLKVDSGVLSPCQVTQNCSTQLTDGFIPVVSNSIMDTELTLKVDRKSVFPLQVTQNCSLSLTHGHIATETRQFDEQNQSSAKFEKDDTGESFDASCVPESTYVPETELIDGDQLSETVSLGHAPDTVQAYVSNKLKNAPSLADADNIGTSIPKLHEKLDVCRNGFDVFLDSHGNYVKDYRNEHGQGVTMYPVMDECSRFDFNQMSRSVEKPESPKMTNFIQESWNELRCCSDIRQYAAVEEKDASQILKITYGMSSLISEADLLFSNCQLLCNEFFESSRGLSEVFDVSSWCVQQLHLASTVVHHGFCCCMKDIASTRPNIDSETQVSLGAEILTSTTDAMAQDTIMQGDERSCRPSYSGTFGLSLLNNNILFKSDMHSRLDVIQSIVPPRSRLAVKGIAFHEYLSSLGHISRSEATRLSGATGKMKRQRSRRVRHYLGTGAMMLSPEDISLLGQHNYPLKY